MSVDEAKDQTFSNNATSKLLGYDYQKLIALECCLNSKPGDIVYLECYGDFATDDTSVEVKKRAENYVMTDQSPDFWKTLKNFVVERNIIVQFSKLILHTTASVENTIFFEWNSKTAEERFSLIKQFQQNPNKSIKKFTDIIFDFNETYTENDLLEILQKLQINASQPSIREKCDEIKQCQTFMTIDERLREGLLERLYGYISMKAIDDCNMWRIFYDIFIKEIQQEIRLYQQNEIPFPEKPIDVEYTGNEKYRFIDELNAIGLETEIGDAVIQYFMAEKNSFKLIETGGPAIQKSIDLFESELMDKMKIQKQRDAIDLMQIDIFTEKAKKTSKKLFLNCKLFEKMKIRGVQPIEMYFQHGKIHKIVDEQGFCWTFLKEDLS
jgi:hypothetical protein